MSADFNNPFAKRFGQTGGSQVSGKQHAARRQPQSNPFETVPQPKDGLGSFQAQMQQGVINPNLNTPVPAQGQGGKFLAIG